MESKALKIPYRKETENLITQYSKFWERIVAIKNQAFGPSYLRSFVFPYPNTLLLSIQPGYHKALESGTVFKEKPKFGDYVGELSYLLPRMLRSDDIADIFLRIAQGEKIDVHFVEQILTDYKEKDESIKRPEARGRRYKVLNDENGDKHIYFEIRRQTLNDSKNPPTDYLEMMSFLGFFEMTRFLFKLSIEKPELYKITEEERNKLLVLINKYLENSGKKLKTTN